MRLHEPDPLPLWTSTCGRHEIHSFIHSGHFYSAISSPLLLRGAPDYNTDTVSEFHAETHSQLQVKALPKAPTWRLEWGRIHDPPVESHRLNQGATTSHSALLKQLVQWPSDLKLKLEYNMIEIYLKL